MSDASITPTPADLARELIRLAEAADKADQEFRVSQDRNLGAVSDYYDDARDDYAKAHARTIAEALLAAENAALKGKGCRQCGVAAADMVTDTYCAACRVEELKADNGWWAGKCEQLQSAVATLRSQLSRIDYAFGEPNEMGVSPYDVDLDGERVVRQVEAILKPLPEPPTEDK